MEHHDCRPPGGRRPLEASKEWICPECGDRWEGHALGSTNPAPGYDFATGEHFTPAEWVRVGQPLTESERETLRSLLEHEQTSGGEVGGWFGVVAAHVRFAREADPDEDVEGQVSEALAALERKGCVRKIGETEDEARFPIYTVASGGFRRLQD